MADDFKYDVFLCYSSKDNVVVRDVAERLKNDGLWVWFDDWELKPGDNIPAKIEDGLDQSRVLMLCMSANAFGSDWARLEAGTFRFRDPLNKERRVIPLRLDDAPIKGFLSQLVHINWRAEDRDQEYAKLFNRCLSPRSQSINTSYDTTIRRIAALLWEEYDNSTRKVKWRLQELANSDQYVELRNPVRNEIWRLFDQRTVVQRNEKWEWISNGH
jgi:hypothetical protein